MKKILTLSILFTMILSFNAFAMNYEPKGASPLNEEKHDGVTQNYKWVWLNDELCVQFEPNRRFKLDDIKYRYDLGLLLRWGERTGNESQAKHRYTYSGKWSQSADGIWSFEFDDQTIPLGLTKIDGILYSFNGYGELADGVMYWDKSVKATSPFDSYGRKTGADGVVTDSSPEFLEYLATQYVPDCSSHQ